MKVVLLNGPPRSGKDFAGEELRYILDGYVSLFKMAKELKDRTHLLYRLGDVPHDHFEHVKDNPRHEFEGLTPRQAYIAVSEKLIKPMHGEQQFGRWLVAQMETSTAGWAVITDAGFRGECETIIDQFGAANVHLVRIHRKRHDFANDSRSYLDLEDLRVSCHDITNDGDTRFPKELRRLSSSLV